MNKISEKIKKLRQQTSASISNCKEALEEAKNDLDKAKELLRKKGQEVAFEKAERKTTEGLVESYIHSSNKVGVLLEINCETDFVAQNDEFKNLAHDIAMHIAAMDPDYIITKDIPKKSKVQKDAKRCENRRFYKDFTKSKAEDKCLLSQPFIKNPEITVGDLIVEAVSKLGENIQIKRFTRYELGENIKDQK